MSMSDSIADMLTRIRNAQNRKILTVILPYSKLKYKILSVLHTEGYINKVNKLSGDNNKSYLELFLKYSLSGKPAIQEIHRVSKPGCRIYYPIDKLRGYFNNMGIQILSTSQGVISDREARIRRVGGEIICKVF